MRNRVILLVAVFVAALLFAGAARAQKVGDGGKAMWQGKEYEVKITKVSKDGAKCHVTWPGYSKSWDEWRPCSEIRLSSTGKVAATPSGGFNSGDSVSIKWKGGWYPGSILKVDDKKGAYLVHYDNYSGSWDEWVKSDRLKTK